MQEMNALALDLVEVLLVAVESSFGGAPVVVVTPVTDQLLQIGSVAALLPRRAGASLGQRVRARRSPQIDSGRLRAPRYETSSIGLAQPSVGGAGGRSGRTEPAPTPGRKRPAG